VSCDLEIALQTLFDFLKIIRDGHRYSRQSQTIITLLRCDWYYLFNSAKLVSALAFFYK